MKHLRTFESFDDEHEELIDYAKSGRFSETKPEFNRIDLARTAESVSKRYKEILNSEELKSKFGYSNYNEEYDIDNGELIFTFDNLSTSELISLRVWIDVRLRGNSLNGDYKYYPRYKNDSLVVYLDGRP